MKNGMSATTAMIWVPTLLLETFLKNLTTGYSNFFIDYQDFILVNIAHVAHVAYAADLNLQTKSVFVFVSTVNGLTLLKPTPSYKRKTHLPYKVIFEIMSLTYVK